LKPFASNRLDQGLVGTSVADRMPDCIDAAGERRLGNDSPFPDGVEQIIFADHPITVVDQVDEQIEDLRSDIDQLVAAPQLAAIHVYRIFTELKWHSGPPPPAVAPGTPASPEKLGYFRGKLSPCQSLARWAPASSDTIRSIGATMTTEGVRHALSAI
jgi:hypothetical protein